MVCGLAQAQPVVPGEHWQKVEPASAGWSPDKLKEADEIATAIGSSAYLVVHRGRIVHEFGRTSTASDIKSMRKSILSMLYGIHVSRGDIRLDEPLKSIGINDKEGLTEAEQSATVRQLLQARSGVYHPAAYETTSMAAERPARGSHAPGEFWYYNNWDFNALGTIFNKKTNITVFEAMDKELAKPLGFEDFSPVLDTRNVYERASEHPAYVMKISARDMARIGLLMARYGRWGDKQILPLEWVLESTKAYSTTRRDTVGYGYLWWLNMGVWPSLVKKDRPPFYANGHLGQYVVVDPTRDLVIVNRVQEISSSARGGRPQPAVSITQFGQLLERIMAAFPKS